MSSVIETEQDGNVRTIILNRPDKMNAISDELAWGVLSAVESAVQDDSVWVIAITGTGNAFCAGLDLTGERDPTQSALSPQSRQIDDIGWVGRFLLVQRENATSQSSPASTAQRSARDWHLPWRRTYASSPATHA